jgi:hypothetical protein
MERDFPVANDRFDLDVNDAADSVFRLLPRHLVASEPGGDGSEATRVRTATSCVEANPLSV